MAKAISDTSTLTAWKCRQTAIGVARRPDLALLIAATDVSDRQTLSGAVRGAMDAAASDSAANIGTALHSMSEIADRGDDLTGFPEEFRRDIEAYRATMQTNNVQVLATEQFVVCDELQTAGTFDRAVLHNGDRIIADIKTGAQAPKYALETAAQVALYARSKLYDPETGARLDMNMNLERGLLIHLPQGEGECTLYDLDLDLGWQVACLAFDVRAMRKQKYAKALGA